MKVYRGYNKDIGPISYNDWIYVTPDLEQAKWYASRDGQIKNGEVIEYEISDKLNFLSIDNVNNIMANENEEYSINDLLWYQEGLTDYLYDYGAGIEFEDPKFKNHKIYIIFDKNYLKNGRIMKNNLNEAYIKAEKGNIYYTKNSDMFLSMVKSIFISKNIPVRVYYDITKGLYVFGDAFNYIHADLANGMKYHSNIYGPDEMRANVSYLRENCALFQVLPDDDFKKYDVGDGYTDGWFLKIDDLIFACRNKQYHKLRDEVPLFKDYIGYWMPTDYYIAKKQGLTESVDPKLNNNFWKWFGNSKVVDKKGNPLVVYHGSGANNIQEFDPSKGFNVDAIYFSDKLSVASHWSGDYLVKKKVRIEKTEDVNKLLKILNEFVKAKIVNYNGYYRLELKYDDGVESSSPLGEKIDDRYYQKGDGTKTDLVKILQRNIETFAFKSENSGNYACYLSIQKPLEIYAGKKPYWKIEFMGKEVNTETIAAYAKQNGYDGVIIYDVYETDYENQLCNDYIVFNPNQIKSVDNNGEWSSTSKNINESVEDKILYIIRGVPGSGKSTLAHKLTDNVVEADQYFYDDKGNYNWSADKLNQAHNWCFYTVKKYMEEGRDKIAVANTFVKNRDYKRYVELAKEFGYKVDIRTCTGNYQNIHNVPDETVEKMRNKFQETPLDESIAYASKKDLSDIILKNPTKKELKDNNLVQCRCMEDGEGNWYFADMENMLHCYMEHSLRDETYFPYYDENDSYGISYYDAGTNEFWYNPNEMMTKQECINQYKNSEYLRTTFPNARVIQNPWGDQVVDDLYDDEEEQLDESAENDRTLRDYAAKLANICLDALVKTKYETKISKDQVQINVDKAFKKAVPMLKNSPYEYFIILVSKNDEPNASYGKSVDRKYGIITLPVFSKDPIDQTLSILYKHKSMLNKLYSTYSGDELKLKINEYAIKYLKKELEKSLSNVKSEYIDILIHECTHLLDDVRRTKTYKSKEQNLKDNKGIEDYYNSPEEQNAFYQETISAFDEWIKSEDWKKDWKNFNNFQNEFIRQYKGDYDKLNNINKRKLKKRIYAYWELYIKD